MKHEEIAELAMNTIDSLNALGLSPNNPSVLVGFVKYLAFSTLQEHPELQPSDLVNVLRAVASVIEEEALKELN